MSISSRTQDRNMPLPLARKDSKDSKSASLMELYRKQPFLTESMTIVCSSDISISEDGRVSSSGQRDLNKCFIRAQPQLPDLEERSALSANKQLHRLSQLLADPDELSYTQVDHTTWMSAEEYIRQKPKIRQPVKVEPQHAGCRLTTNSNWLCDETAETNCTKTDKSQATEPAVQKIKKCKAKRKHEHLHLGVADIKDRQKIRSSKMERQQIQKQANTVVTAAVAADELVETVETVETVGRVGRVGSVDRVDRVGREGRLGTVDTVATGDTVDEVGTVEPVDRVDIVDSVGTAIATNQVLIDEAKLAENIAEAVTKLTNELIDDKLKSSLELHKLKISSLSTKQYEAGICTKKPSENIEMPHLVVPAKGEGGETNEILKLGQHVLCQLDDWHAITLLPVLGTLLYIVYILGYDVNEYVNEERRYQAKVRTVGAVLKCVYRILRLLRVPIF